MMLKKLCLTALAGLAARPCQADLVVFSVSNPTGERWELRDQTQRSPGVALVFGAVDPAAAGSLRQAAAWCIEPGASMIFMAEAASAFPGGVELGLWPAPGNPIVPACPASVTVPLGVHTLETAIPGPGQVWNCNRWRITAEGLFRGDMPDSGPGDALPTLRGGAKRTWGAMGEARTESGPTVPPDRLEPAKVRRMEPAARSVAPASPMEGEPAGLILENRSQAVWLLSAAGDGLLPPATLRSIPGLGPDRPGVAEPEDVLWQGRKRRRFRIPPGEQLRLHPPRNGETCPRAYEFRLLDGKQRNPHKALIKVLFGAPGYPKLVYKNKKLLASGCPVQWRGSALCLLTDAWSTRVAQAPGEPPGPALASASTPTLPDAAPLSPGTSDSASTSASMASCRDSTPASPAPPGPSVPASMTSLPDAAPSPTTGGRVCSTCGSRTFPGQRGVMGDLVWREALRQDLAHSPMFLGTEEGGLLAQRMNLVLDLHSPLVFLDGEPQRDALGRQQIHGVTRLGSAAAAPPHPEGLILLQVGRHYTVARPAAPGEPAPFATLEGSAYAEITREVTDGLGPPERVSGLPSDGHCLIAALHFLKHGQLPDPGQIAAHRAQVAMDLAPETLTRLVLDLAEEVLRETHPLQDDGCFATLGPRVSALLKADPGFMARYHDRVVEYGQAAAYLAAQAGGRMGAGRDDGLGWIDPPGGTAPRVPGNSGHAHGSGTSASGPALLVGPLGP